MLSLNTAFYQEYKYYINQTKISISNYKSIHTNIFEMQNPKVSSSKRPITYYVKWQSDQLEGKPSTGKKQSGVTLVTNTYTIYLM